MKKVVAFLLCLIIFVTPVTTLVKADVVIGDNDETIINENATIIGRKLALMESLSDLALSGVSEFTISNTEDVDSYLDYLWNEVNNAIDSLSDGTGFDEISNTLKSKYFTNLVQYKDYIDNRGNYFANLLPSGNPTTTLLKTFFADNIFGKQTTQHYNLALDTFRALSALNRGITPNPDPDFTFINTINDMYISIDNLSYNFFNVNQEVYTNTASPPQLRTPLIDMDYVSYYNPYNDYTYFSHNASSPVNELRFGVFNDIVSIYVNYTEESDINVTYYLNDSLITNTNNYLYYWTNVLGPTNGWFSNDRLIRFTSYDSKLYSSSPHVISNTTFQSNFGGLSTCINYIYLHFSNINLYVNGEPWAVVGSGVSSNPTLDIDGLLKIFGNNNPIQYNIQPNTKLDYDQLYQVIYNAIRDNLPISQGDINYYDSHDTIYSPTIINNYGEDEGNESDLIDTILDYAVIPKFDTAIAQPMRNALTNGVVIMNNSITNVIPNEILLIFGACFFLLLFAVVINRMIK